jgi:hypothetical protein
MMMFSMQGRRDCIILERKERLGVPAVFNKVGRALHKLGRNDRDVCMILLVLSFNG